MIIKTKILAFSGAAFLGAIIFFAFAPNVEATSLPVTTDCPVVGFGDLIDGPQTCNLSATLTPTLSIPGSDGSTNCPLIQNCKQTFSLDATWSVGCVVRIELVIPSLSISKTFNPSATSTGILKTYTVDVDCGDEVDGFVAFYDHNGDTIDVMVFTIFCETCPPGL